MVPGGTPFPVPDWVPTKFLIPWHRDGKPCLFSRGDTCLACSVALVAFTKEFMWRVAVRAPCTEAFTAMARSTLYIFSPVLQTDLLTLASDGRTCTKHATQASQTVEVAVAV